MVQRNPRLAAASLALFMCAACAANSDDAPAQVANAADPATASILASSKPAAGATVAAPVNELVLHFSPPARLLDVTVTGPDGTMPMMVSAVGEVDHYSLPLSGLRPGRYSIAWRASRGGADHRGSFGFAVE